MLVDYLKQCLLLFKRYTIDPPVALFISWKSFFIQLIATYSANFITKTQLEALFAHMKVSGTVHVLGHMHCHYYHHLLFSYYLFIFLFYLFVIGQGEYIQRPLELVRVVQMCLVTEAELVRKQEEFEKSNVCITL